MSSGYQTNYDPNLIMKAADERLAQGDLEGGQLVYQSALLDWVDHARESGGVPSDVDPEQLREAIATLWQAYANFLRKAKQFKSATEAYEQAVACPVASKVGKVWLDYARFAEDRGKMRTAQQVYLRALVGDGKGEAAAISDEQDRQFLWDAFLDMMQRSNNPNLTMAELKKAVASEHLHNKAVASSRKSPVPPDLAQASGMSNPTPGSVGASTDSNKRQRLHQDHSFDTSMEESKTHVVTAESVESGRQSFLASTQWQSQQLPPEVAGAWMVRDGDAPPQPPEPPLFGPTPPKLSDPTGRDLLGDDLALLLIQRLAKPSGTVILQSCEGLWMLTALKEREAKMALQTLDETIKAEWQRLEDTLDERVSVAGAALSAVQQMNERERTSFRHSCTQQRQTLLSNLAWEIRHLQCLQQQVLTKLNIPTFDGPTVDASALELQARVCSFLHSAFYLRNRIGAKTHASMLVSQEERLKKSLASRPEVVSPPQQPSFSPPPPHANFNYPPPMPPPMQQAPYRQPPPPPIQQPQPMAYPGQPPMPPPGQLMPPNQPNNFYQQPYYYQ